MRITNLLRVTSTLSHLVVINLDADNLAMASGLTGAESTSLHLLQSASRLRTNITTALSLC